MVSRLEPDAEASLIADLVEPEQRVVVALGGQGGWGNTRFATSTNQTPRVAQRGETGQEADILLELKIIADVGIIGYPNVGKSSLLAAATAAHPKIAGYPFTTLDPELGAVEVGQDMFVLAEVPGLIADAHLGRGLGHEFLRHVARTRLLLHLVDGSSESPVEDMNRVNEELRLYDAGLAGKPQLVAVNKIDITGVRAAIPQIRDDFASIGIKAHFLAAATGEGVPELMGAACRILRERITEPDRAPEEVKVFRPQPRTARVSVHREDEVYVVTAARLERMITQDDRGGPPDFYRIRPYLERFGVNRALRQAGIKPGEKVRCGQLEWVWEEVM
jgi:GTP-binding protein